jgi:hypothetical protein
MALFAVYVCPSQWRHLIFVLYRRSVFDSVRRAEARIFESSSSDDCPGNFRRLSYKSQNFYRQRSSCHRAHARFVPVQGTQDVFPAFVLFLSSRYTVALRSEDLPGFDGVHIAHRSCLIAQVHRRAKTSTS